MEIFDVLVLGAGPGGAAVSTLLARRGYRVAMLDRAQQPAPHLPESWLPADAALLEPLGLAPATIQPSFLPAAEARFYSACGADGLRVQLESLASDPARRLVRLDRAAFDQILVRNAGEAGVHYLPLHSVSELSFLDTTSPTVRAQTPAGSVAFSARVVVDASGKSALVASKLGLKQVQASLDPRTAVFSHFIGQSWQQTLPAHAMAIISLAHGYSFAIPLGAERISVGVVVDQAEAAPYAADYERLFNAQLQQSALLGALLRDATRALPYIPALNHAYRCSQYAGPGYYIVGEAGAFLDPFFSNGISMALKSALLAAEVIGEVLQAGGEDQQLAAQAAYSSAFGELVRQSEQGAATVFASGDYRRFLMSCADPHLPQLLPLALLVPGYARSAGQGELPDLQRMLRDARDAFLTPVAG